jgi:uncharacterized protein (UPF0332 family)
VSAAEIRSLMERAKRSVRSARNLLEDGDFDFALSRAYYAMFYAAKAALLRRGVQRSKHSGVIAAFAEHLVKPGCFPTADQRNLQAAFQERSEGDYAGIFPSREKTEQRLRDADDFVARIAVFLREEGLPQDP